MRILVQGSFIWYLLSLHLICPPCSSIPRVSRIAYSSVSNTSLFLPRNLFRDFYSWLCHATLVPVQPESSLELFMQNDISPGPSECFLHFSVSFSLSLTKGTILPGMVSGSIYLVCFVPAVVLMLEVPVTVHARHCPSVSFPLLLGLNQSLSTSASFPNCVCFFLSCSVIGRMSLMSCDFTAASCLYLNLCCWLLIRKSASRGHASSTTATLGAERNIPVTGRPCLLTILRYSLH